MPPESPEAKKSPGLKIAEKVVALTAGGIVHNQSLLSGMALYYHNLPVCTRR